MSIAEFADVRFPVDLSFGSSGGPQRVTEIVALGSGAEKRNQRWAHSKRSYDAGYGVKTLDDLYEIVAFYEARRGPLQAFRFRDPSDWKSCKPSGQPSAQDQEVGVGDGQTIRFPLVKTYGVGAGAYQRPIALPVPHSVLVAVDGVELNPAQDFSIEGDAGNADLVLSQAPPIGSAITAGFEFDVPVRFADDKMTVNLAAFNAGDLPSIPLQEVLL